MCPYCGDNLWVIIFRPFVDSLWLCTRDFLHISHFFEKRKKKKKEKKRVDIVYYNCTLSLSLLLPAPLLSSLLPCPVPFGRAHFMFVVGKILWITLYFLIYDWLLIVITSFAVAFCKELSLICCLFSLNQLYYWWFIFCQIIWICRIVGMAGIGESLLLVSFCGLCTFLTGISLSAIATNGAMKVDIVCN